MGLQTGFTLLLLAAGVASTAALQVTHSVDGGETFLDAGSIDVNAGVFDRKTPSGALLDALRDTVQRGGRYYLTVTPSNGGLAVTASAPADCVAAGLLQSDPELILHLGAGGQGLVGVSLPPAAAGGCGSAAALRRIDQLAKGSRSDADLARPVAVKSPVRAPDVPQIIAPEQAAAQQLGGASAAAAAAAQQQQQQRKQQQQQQKREGGAEGEGDGEGSKEPPVDDRTWLQKNQVFVMAGVMMVVNVALQRLVPPPPQQQGARRPAAGAGAAAAAAAQR